MASPAGLGLAKAMAEQLPLHGFVFHVEPILGASMFCWVLGWRLRRKDTTYKNYAFPKEGLKH